MTLNPSISQMPQYLEKLHAFINDTVLQTPFWRDILSGELTVKLQEYLGRTPGFQMRPQLEDVEEWIKSLPRNEFRRSRLQKTRSRLSEPHSTRRPSSR